MPLTSTRERNMKITIDESREPHWVLSQANGFANAAKDFRWLEKNIPCQAACPAGTDIPEYLDAIARGNFEYAYRINLRDNVFPAVLGRVCSRPCEPACRHGWEGLGESVAICFSKRSAGDFMHKNPIVLPQLFKPTGKKVAVIGAGVAGLATARDLALFGHFVKVFEKHRSPGGMLNQGIPEFRLPRDIIEKEIEQVRLCGVEITCDIEVGIDVTLEHLMKDFDAIVMAAGTLKPNLLDIPGKELDAIQHGLGYLLGANEYGDHDLAGDVVIIGGGFTAMDCARTSLRCGAESVKVYYRRSRDEMLVTDEEVRELDNEGIPIEYQVNPKSYVGSDGDAVSGIEFCRTQLGNFDSSGRRMPVEVPDSRFEIKANVVQLATGQFPDTGWIDHSLKGSLVGDNGWLTSGEKVCTDIDKIFVAGDFALGATTLIDAIGHAKKCARAVDRFLQGEDRLADAVFIEDVSSTNRDSKANSIPRHEMPTIPVEERSVTAEVESGYLKADAKTEALRCYLCSYKFEIDNELCIYCDGCLRVMPVDNCIVKVNSFTYDEDGTIVDYVRSKNSLDYNWLYIDQNECIRCGACADVCPVECIPIQKVSKKSTKAIELEPLDTSNL